MHKYAYNTTKNQFSLDIIKVENNNMRKNTMRKITKPLNLKICIMK